ncbi:PREDICTED: geraniol 8-hydroxylase-like [Nicotiana attenuata]|uniref:7-ethoxycoumarin o-deethylase n=1 Tax=Nicotiana attenuata TaxID=49451 RepID=A0A1J6IB83_NICAT|nr:PREDICTED: geraniol 8-hydroxylase-like [Nicotiana attenuata]OIT01834.1 7-ethoxycoumarin o-deethylase [Nicotiana attenuata]
MDYLTLVFGSNFACIFLLFLSKRNKRLPPGPLQLPIIGNLFHLLGAKPHISLANLAKTYGPIMSLKLGQITTIVISSSTMAKQVLQNQDQAFSNRFIPNALQAHNYSKFSVTWLPVNPTWRTLRRILNSNILSLTKLDSDQHLRSQKVQQLVDYVAKCSQEGEAVIIGKAAFKTSLNLLSNILFSKDLVDPLFDTKVELKDVIWNILAEAGKPNLVDFFPILENIDPQRIRRNTDIHISKLFVLFDDLINERLEEKRSSSTKNDVLEVFLKIREENSEEIDQNHINSLLLDIFIGGTNTTTSTVEWAMAEILRQPEIMKKVQAELAEVVGKGKPIKEDDVSRLSYLQCIVKETLRMHPPVPFLLPRKVEDDVEVCGYIVPKGSQVLVNVWTIGRDSALWEEPLVFKPERFWSSELDVRGKDFELIPFGAGRRICPGLPLAALRMVPVMVGSLLNSFNWKPEGGIKPEELDMEEKFGITLAKACPLRAIAYPI